MGERRGPGLPVEAITALILVVVVFVGLAAAVMSGRLPLPNFAF